MLKVTREAKRGRRPKLSEEQKDQIVQAFNSGTTLTELCKTFDCSMSTIRKCIAERK